MLLKFKNHLNLKYLACSNIYFIQLQYCSTIQDAYFSYGQTLFVSCMLPWQPLRHKDYPHFKNHVRPFIACFIKQFVNLCLLHSLYSSIDDKLQETHRISQILVLHSFNYSDLKTLMSSTSKRHQQFYDVMFRLHQLHTFQRSYLCYW